MRDIWIYRFLLLLTFVLFDVLATSVSISGPIDEGNMLTRIFMNSLGVYLGLAFFGLFIAGFLFFTVAVCRLLVVNCGKLASTISSFVIDGCFSWFVAGVHFVGGTSWFWFAPDMLRHCLGAGLYLLALYLFMVKFWHHKY